MIKSIFKISEMDCPSEEQMIRLKLEDISEIEQLKFDIQSRKLEVIYSGNYNGIFTKLSSLNLGTELVSTETTEEKIDINYKDKIERILLWQVLAINFSFFIVEIVTGIISGSTGLLADSLDMLADSFVYGLALFVVGAAVSKKKAIARLSGNLQLLLAIVGLIEVFRRIIIPEKAPEYLFMIIISSIALIGNALSLYLLQRSRSEEAHLRASMIFTSNDVIINIGVILAGFLVYITNSKYPDLIIGIIVFGIVAKGSFRIMKLAK